jgi:hypothetical protein
MYNRLAIQFMLENYNHKNNGISNFAVNYDKVKELLKDAPYFIKCSTTASSPYYVLKSTENKSDLNLPIVQECQGLILEKNTNKIIAHGLNRIGTDISEIKEDEIIAVNEMIDGPRIFVWWNIYLNDWSISTGGSTDATSINTICINPSNPKYIIKKSFYELFMETNPDFSNLDKSYTYTYILEHPFITHDPSTQIAAHLIFIRNNNSHSPDISHIKKTSILNSFSNKGELNEYVTSPQYNKKGVIITVHNKLGMHTQYFQYKILNPNYEQKQLIKGNTQNITYYLINCIKNNETDSLLEFYPIYNKTIQTINNCIVEISKRIYWQYINKHVFKKDVKFTPAYYPTIRQLAGTYIQTKETITKKYVLDIVNKFPTPLITSLINKTLLKL